MLSSETGKRTRQLCLLCLSNQRMYKYHQSMHIWSYMPYAYCMPVWSCMHVTMCTLHVHGFRQPREYFGDDLGKGQGLKGEALLSSSVTYPLHPTAEKTLCHPLHLCISLLSALVLLFLGFLHCHSFVLTELSCISCLSHPTARTKHWDHWSLGKWTMLASYVSYG